MALEWEPVYGTSNWILVDREVSPQAIRQIAVRDPYSNEGGGKKFVVSGDGHDDDATHDSWDAAKAAAMRTLR